MIKFEDVLPPEEGDEDPLALLAAADENPQCFEGLAKDELDMDLQDLKEEPDLGDAHTTS